MVCAISDLDGARCTARDAPPRGGGGGGRCGSRGALPLGPRPLPCHFPRAGRRCRFCSPPPTAGLTSRRRPPRPAHGSRPRRGPCRWGGRRSAPPPGSRRASSWRGKGHTVRAPGPRRGTKFPARLATPFISMAAPPPGRTGGAGPRARRTAAPANEKSRDSGLFQPEAFPAPVALARG